MLQMCKHATLHVRTYVDLILIIYQGLPMLEELTSSSGSVESFCEDCIGQRAERSKYDPEHMEVESLSHIRSLFP